MNTDDLIVDYKHNKITKEQRNNNEDYDKCCSDIERVSRQLYDQIMSIKSKLPIEVMNKLNSLYFDMNVHNSLCRNASSVQESEKYRRISNNILNELYSIESMIPSYINDEELYKNTRDLYYYLDCMISDKYNEFDKWYLD